MFELCVLVSWPESDELSERRCVVFSFFVGLGQESPGTLVALVRGTLFHGLSG